VTLVFVLALAAAALPAAANPIAMGTSHAAQVPETFHVQVSWGCNDDYQPTGAAPAALIRDGETVAATWLGPEGESRSRWEGRDVMPAHNLVVRWSEGHRAVARSVGDRAGAGVGP
jgi:hypothetical protein